MCFIIVKDKTQFMKSTFLVICILFLTCSNDTSEIIEQDNNIPSVKQSSTYNIITEQDIVYAQGLSHTDWNTSQTTTQDLMLDVYYPDNELDNRPVYLFIHGGGFIGGDKQGGSVFNLANFYASRGWVFVSINYRLRDDFGTIPQQWEDYTSNITDPTVDIDQANAIYPAQRDAKAAMRWLVTNADNYKINTNYITVGGGSAGAITAITVGVSEPEDFTDEISSTEDTTLSTTNLNSTYQVKTIIDHWGSKVALDILEDIYGHQRFDANDPPLFIVHGTQDPTVDYSNALALKAIYENLNIPLAFYPIDEPGHGFWNTIIDGKRLEELAFDFIVEQQQLQID